MKKVMPIILTNRLVRRICAFWIGLSVFFSISASAETYVCFWQDKPGEPNTVFVTDNFVGGRDGAEIAQFDRIIGNSRIYSAEIQNGNVLQSIKVIFDGYDIHYFWTTYTEETEGVIYEYYRGSCK